MKELFTKLLLAEAAVGVVALVLVEGFPRQLIALFGAANESVYYTDFAVKSFRIYLCMIILACVNKACFIFLQAMGKAVESTALSMCVRWCSAWALPCCCPGSSGWTACCTPCPCRISSPS